MYQGIEIIQVNLSDNVFFKQFFVMDRFYFGVWDPRSNIHFTLAVAYGSSKIALYSKEMSESLNVAEVCPVHKITFPAEFSSSLAIKFSLSP